MCNTYQYLLWNISKYKYNKRSMMHRILNCAPKVGNHASKTRSCARYIKWLCFIISSLAKTLHTILFVIFHMIWVIILHWEMDYFLMSAMALRLVSLYSLNYQCLDSLYADFQVTLCIYSTIPTFVHKCKSSCWWMPELFVHVFIMKAIVRWQWNQ